MVLFSPRRLWVLALLCSVCALAPARLRAQASAQTPGPLGIFEQQSDVGSVTPPGRGSYHAASDTYSISAAGANVWGTTDAFHFMWKKVSGDIALTATVNFPQSGHGHNPHRKAMLMFRQSLDADGVYADAALHGAGLTALQYRRTRGEATADVELNPSEAPRRVRLEKRGDTITMYISTAGETLHPVGASIVLHFEGPFYVGIGLCSHDARVTEHAEFSRVSLDELTAGAGTAAPYSVLETVSTDELNRVATIVLAKTGRVEAPNWTRDGQALVFNEDGKLYRVPVAGGAPALIPTGDATRCGGSHGISPDGKWLAISCSMPDKPETRVYVVPMEGGTPRLVTEHPNSYFHSWSPDGKTIAFTRPDHGSQMILTIPAAGGNETLLTSATGFSDDPDYSPDGKWIYFNSDRAGGSMQIWRMHDDGSDPEQVTDDDLPNWTPHVSPDGKWVPSCGEERGAAHPVARRQQSAYRCPHHRRSGFDQRAVLGAGLQALRVCHLCHADPARVVGRRRKIERSLFYTRSMLEIRLATAADAQTITRHRRQMFIDAGQPDDQAMARMATNFEPWVARMLEEGRYLGWLAVDGEKQGEVVAGLGMLLLDWPAHFLDPDHSERAYLLNVFVERTHRRQGLAGRLLEAALEESRRRGLRVVALHASDEGRPVYERYGFTTTSEMWLVDTP
jgi:TolB protein